MPLFKKQNPEEIIKNTISNLSRSKIRTTIKYNTLEQKLKDIYASNKKPPPALLQGWKVTKSLLNFTENQIASLQNQLLLVDLGKSLKEALGVKKIKDIQKALDKLNLHIFKTEDILEEMGGLQIDGMEMMMQFDQEIEGNSSIMDKMVHNINLQASNELNNEFLNDIKTADPEFFDSIPDHIKTKVI